MKKEEFIKIVLDELGEDGALASEDTNLRSLEMWDSMASLIVVSAVDDCFGIAFTSEQIDGFKTFGDIINAIGDDKFV